MERIYTVEVIGFNATERILLGSVFGLSLKRSPSYRRAESGETAHLRLVDGAQTQAIAQAHERQREQALPVVVVGAAELPPGWFETPRPLHWARLFRALDPLMPAAPRRWPISRCTPGHRHCRHGRGGSSPCMTVCLPRTRQRATARRPKCSPTCASGWPPHERPPRFRWCRSAQADRHSPSFTVTRTPPWSASTRLK